MRLRVNNPTWSGGGEISMAGIIVKENESLDSALRRFKREHYEKPSVRRKKKSEAARKRKYN